MITTRPLNVDLSNLKIALFKDVNGAYEMNVDGSVTPVVFSFSLSSKTAFIPIRIDISIGDDNKYLKPDQFGSIAGGLANGITIDFIKGDAPPGKHITDEFSIKRNWDFTNLVGVNWCIQNFPEGPNKKGVFKLSWPFLMSHGTFVMLPDYKINISVRDDLTSLSVFKTSIHGVYINT